MVTTSIDSTVPGSKPRSMSTANSSCAMRSTPRAQMAPERLAAYWLSGHRADFGVMVMDPDPGKVDGVHQRIMAPRLGRFVEPAWSFVSMSEVSEYVPTIEAFASV